MMMELSKQQQAYIKTTLRYSVSVGLLAMAGVNIAYAGDMTNEGIGVFKRDNSGETTAYGISHDGAVIVGWSNGETRATGKFSGMRDRTINITKRAFRWTQQGGMQDLGSIRQDKPSVGSRVYNEYDITQWESQANAANHDGSVIVGWSNAQATAEHKIGGNDMVSNLAKRAFRWTSSGGMQDLGVFAKNGKSAPGVLYNDYDISPFQSEAKAINRDGTVIVGWSQLSEYLSPLFGGGSDIHNTANKRAFRWTQSGGMQDLGTLHRTQRNIRYPYYYAGESVANAVNRNGSVIVGWAKYSEQISPIPEFFAQDSSLSAVTNTSDQRAFRWTQSGGIQDLGTLYKIRRSFVYNYYSAGKSSAKGVSADGSVIVGWANDTSDTTRQRAFRWTQSTGMTDLGTLKSDNTGQSSANAVSRNGKVIVGWSASASSSKRAFRWTANKGMQDLGTLKSDNSGQSEALAIADDGKIVVGWSHNDAGDKRTFVWRWVRGADDNTDGKGNIYDLHNTQHAVLDSANRQVAGARALGQSLANTLGQEINLDNLPSLATNKNTFSVSFSQSGQRETAQHALPVRHLAQNPTSQYTAGATYSRGNYDGAKYYARMMHFAGFVRQGDKSRDQAPIILGGFLGQGSLQTNLSNFGFKGTIPSRGVFVRYGAEHDAGLSVRVGMAESKGDVRIIRESSLANTETGSGDAVIKNKSYTLTTGYGITQDNGGVITPYATLTHTETNRKGYVEKANIFPISYTPYKVRLTNAKLGVKGQAKPNPNHAVTWDISLQRDLWQKTRNTVANSALPGVTNYTVQAPSRSRKYRPAIGVGYEYGLENNWQLHTKADWSRSRRHSRINKVYTVGFKIGL